MNVTTFPEKSILLVDDEETFLHSISFTLRANNFGNIQQCVGGTDVIRILSENKCHLVLLDLFMPKVSGQELLPIIVSNFPHIPVIVITAIDEVKTAVECMKAGAFNYLVKPVNQDTLITSVKRAIEHLGLQDQITRLTEKLLDDEPSQPESFIPIVTKNKAMLSIFRYIEAIAGTPLPVLITGETGVGKDLIAQAIHEVSGRSGNLVSINVAGLDDNLFSDTLFGHKKGAFTGANQERMGLIRQASNGTIFLDEIGDLKIESQVKLLRLLQDGNYYPVGSDIEKFSNARIICATNQNLDELIRAKSFRKDLFFRLKPHYIQIPPLRERREDIPLLITHFLEESSEKLNKDQPTPPKELFTLLDTYHFPGNIRELQGMVYDAVSRIRSRKLPLDSFKDQIGYTKSTRRSLSKDSSLEAADFESIIYSEKLPTLKEAETSLIAEALKRASNNQTTASEMLGISRAALYKRLKRSTAENEPAQ